MENSIFIWSQYILVLVSCFLIGCGVLFLIYWAMPQLKRMGCIARIGLVEKEREYMLAKEEYRQLKEKIKKGGVVYHNEADQESI